MYNYKMNSSANFSEEQKTMKNKLHQGLMEFYFFHQYDEYDNREEIYPSMDRWREFDMEGDSYWCYRVY